MFKTLFSILICFSASSAFAVSGLPLRFTLPCRVYQYSGSGENQFQVVAENPQAQSYTLVKTSTPKSNPKKGEAKWDDTYAIEVLLKDKTVKTLPLVSSESGDEDYNEFHVAKELVLDSATYWLSSGSIQNKFIWGNFEGQDSKGESVFFRCEMAE
jgi:hypothetical protein